MNECRIIEDLLPLYTDGLVQEDTMEFVKLHLVRCASCSAKERRLRADVNIPPPPPKIDRKTRFRRAGRRTFWKTFLISATSVILALGIGLGTYLGIIAQYNHRNRLQAMLSFIRNALPRNIDTWMIPEGMDEGNRVRSGNFTFNLPDDGFRRVADGYFTRSVTVPEYDSLFVTSTIRISEEPNVLSVFPSFDEPTQYFNFRALDPELYSRGYELFLELNISTQLELVNYFIDFDRNALNWNSTQDELALGIFVASNYERVFNKGQPHRLTGNLSGYAVTDYQSNTYTWTIFIENPYDSETLYRIRITNEGPTESTHNTWICTDSSVKHILSSVKIL